MRPTPLRALRRAYYQPHSIACTASRCYSTTTSTTTSTTSSTPSSSKSSKTSDILPSSAEATTKTGPPELSADAERLRTEQAPNRSSTWSQGQNPRELAMVGPRFEQIVMKDQPLPYAAIELIHKQPVRWRKERIVSCDGGGGPMGHPRIFINLDKPQIEWCTYCGLPFAHEHNRKHIESLPNNQYPL